MRISTIQAFNSGVRGIQDNYSAVTRTQQQVSSGKRMLTPADDPVASVRLLQLGQESSKLGQYKDNQVAAKNSLTQQESILNSVNNVLQRVREIVLEAGNGALDAGGRQALAQELEKREEELHGLMNSRNARGEYLFGGSKSDIPPFVRQPDGSYDYQGDEGQRSIQIASGRMVAINDNGKELFLDVANITRLETAGSATGNGYISFGSVTDEAAFNNTFPHGGAVTITYLEPIDPADPDSPPRYQITDDNGTVTGDLNPNEDGGYQLNYGGMSVTLSGDLADGETFTVTNTEKRGVLDTLRMLRQGLENHDDSPAGKQQRNEMLAVSLQNLDNAMNKVLGVQTDLGARLNVIESAQLENEEASLINTSVQAGLEELDYAEALSRLSMQSVMLEAAQQSFVKISGLNLFNFLR